VLVVGEANRGSQVISLGRERSKAPTHCARKRFDADQQTAQNVLGEFLMCDVGRLVGLLSEDAVANPRS
jgi:hypothetical protein